ncbi:NADH-dependent [FeFe] hydrogenase, group A6 [Marispirochaeta aestuarii]|uniref:NADH-dependent [FeFe] hydrogenase, group A6 n=1 Tax=Marispirochaeta aestuarii TaxID=1963862 RepID=UPI0029C7A33E|nr:NADH-dependent [FeFe] hydrogenase, group A6 [Marispirochaeta aestuarii]
MVNITVNGLPLEVAKGTTLLKAAKLVGIKIPTLCYHADLPAWAACGICVVKVEGSPKLFRACATQVQDGMKIITHDPELYEIRRTVIQLIMSTHPNDCLSCPRNGNCELQTLAADFGIRDVPFEHRVPEIPLDDSTPSIILNPEKCIKCGRCVNVCQQMQDVWALEFIGRGDGTRMAGAGDVLLNETPCIKCGQCSAHCPVGAIYEKDETRTLMRAIRDPEKHVAVQIAPAVRVAIGEAFGMEPGTISTGKIYAALRMMGVDAVFDTNFSADLTIMEEGTELVKRLTEGGTLPQITSCCPAWTDYMEKYFPDMIPHFSSAKSPMMMQGAITKTYYADRAGIKPENIFSAAIMPCTAKKFEITRCEKMYSSGQQDVDLVLTTRELARLIKALGIDFNSLPDEAADSPIGRYSGAGTIFGNTGGVMEAAIRTAYNLVTGKELEDVNVNAVRGMEGVRRGEVDIDGKKIRVAVAHGMANVRDVMREIQDAREKGKEPPYHFIEVMACRGGCIAGGGQPYNTNDDVREKRIAGMYADDEKSVIRCSHQNPEIKQIYKEFLGKPLSKKAHELLHTNYSPRPLYRK